MTILQFLRVRTSLKVFLEGILANMIGSDGRDGGCVDEGLLRVLIGHVHGKARLC